jgi:hypothetical protein
MDWPTLLKYDPLPALMASPEPAGVYFTKRDLLAEEVPPIDTVWELPEPRKILKKQNQDGSWGKSGTKRDVYPPGHAVLVETFKQFRILVERYEFTHDHPAIPHAAEFLFSFQTPEGDIRGFIGNQYATYYTGYVLSLLIRAGYADDPRVEKGLAWLLTTRQDDGGWTVPMLTRKFDRETSYRLTSQYALPVEPDRTKPFSHNWTDMVLRGFAAHPEYRKAPEARAAGELLKSSFFKPDTYTSYRAPHYWTRFLFWWPNLLTALESLYHLGFTKDDPDIQRGLDWFITSQQKDSMWKLESHRLILPKDQPERLWLGLRICRMLKCYYDD